MNREVKMLLYIFCVICICFIGFLFLPNILGLFYSDIGPINDSDLQVKNILIAEADNSYFDLMKLRGTIYVPDIPENKDYALRDIADGKVWDESMVKDFLAKNTEVLKYISIAASKSSFQDPMYSDPIKIPYRVDQGFLTNDDLVAISNLNKIYALYLIRQGNPKEAMSVAFNLLKIGQKMLGSQETTIEYLMASNLKLSGLETIRLVINSANLSNIDLNRYNQDLNQFYNNKEGPVSAMKVEYQMQVRAVDLVSKGGGKNNKQVGSLVGADQGSLASGFSVNDYYFHPNETKAVFAEQARYVIDNIDKPISLLPTDPVKNHYSPVSPFLGVKMYFTENLIGKMLFDSMSLVVLRGCLISRGLESLSIGATQAMIAIKEYQNDNGKPPTSLNQLVSKYLSEIPNDPFANTPLKYSEEKKLIYSVGMKGIDTGGSTDEDWKYAENPGFVFTF